MPTIEAGDLTTWYLDEGPADAPVVLLLHGGPDDASTWNRVTPRLNDGFRTIVPMLRGFGKTRFTSASTLRTGNSAVLAMDAVALLNALDVDRLSVGRTPALVAQKLVAFLRSPGSR